MQKYLNGGYVCEDTKKAKVSYSDLYVGLFSWNHIFECCFDQVCCRCGNLERVVQKPVSWL